MIFESIKFSLLLSDNTIIDIILILIPNNKKIIILFETIIFDNLKIHPIDINTKYILFSSNNPFIAIYRENKSLLLYSENNINMNSIHSNIILVTISDNNRIYLANFLLVSKLFQLFARLNKIIQKKFLSNLIYNNLERNMIK